jgi:hypothetical protein
MAYDAVKESVAEAGEQVNDLVAEARAEISEASNGASEEGTRSRRRRRS